MKKLILILQFSVMLFSQNVWAQATKADTIHVLHYNINLEIRNLLQKEIKGFTDVTVEAKIAPLNHILLHFWGLTVDSIKKENETIGFLHQEQQLKIDLSFQEIEHPETIRIFYHGTPIQESWGGFRFSDSTYAFNMGVSMKSYPHSFGRVWFPCIDEFTDKSTYTFNITTDADKKAVCGGVLTDSIPVENGICWRWELTDPIATYLASVAVGKYKVYKDTMQGVENILPIEIYADSATILKVSGSFANLKTFIHTYEKRWGPCRWQRIGYVAVPFSDGAMEHATNIAYPRGSINGNTNNQDLIAHELAHSWFGNLITCATSQNMWINEGFATYGEYLCIEALDPTLENYKSEIKKLHFKVLRNDGGLYALDNVPAPNATYGSTTYDKGGLVAYTLRNYMGDDLYFSSIKQFLNENQYSNVNSEELFAKLSHISGLDLHDFFLGWVHQPGFLNFNIDSIKSIQGSNNRYEIALKQKLYFAQNHANNNKLDVEFYSETGTKHLIENISFSGEHEIVEVDIPFEPVFWSIDPNGKMGDACFDYTQQITKKGITSFSNANFEIMVDEWYKTSIVRVEHNPVAPTNATSAHPDIVKISDKHFWRVGFLQYEDMQATYSFLYDSKYDGELAPKENLILLYRKDASHDWQIIPAIVTASNASSGKVSVHYMFPGEYTLGIGKNMAIKDLEKEIEIFPNPTTGELTITNYEARITGVELFDIYGRKVSSPPLHPSSSHQKVDISDLPSGTYILEIVLENNKTCKKIIKL